MKKILLSILLSAGISSASFAQVLPGVHRLQSLPIDIRSMNKIGFRELMNKAKLADQANGAENKVPVKMPVFIYTQAWDSASRTYNDTLEKYVITYDNNKKLQSVTDYSWDSTNGGVWTRAIQSGFVKFNTPQNLDSNLTAYIFPTSILSQELQAGKWVNTELDSFGIDKNYNLTSIVSKQWKANAWQDYADEEFGYDANNDFVSTLIYYNANGTGLQLVEGIKETFTRNSKGFITSLVQSISGGGPYYDDVQEAYTLDSLGRITTAVVSARSLSSNQWVPYDSLSNITWLKFDPTMRLNLQTGGEVGILGVGGAKYLTYTDTKYDSTSHTWNIPMRNILQYNADSQVVSNMSQYYSSKTWSNNNDDSTTYYPGGDVKTYLDRYWSNGWKNTSKGHNNINKYDGDGDITENIYEISDVINGNVFDKSSKTEYIYEAKTGISQAFAENNEIHIYPNPAAGQLFVSFGQTSASRMNINISDITGKTVQSAESGAGQQIMQMDVSALRPGIYVITVNNGSSVYNYRFVKS